MIVVLLQLISQAKAQNAYTYITTMVTKAGCSYTDLYSEAKVKMYFADEAGTIPAGSPYSPLYLVIENDSTNNFYYASANVQDSVDDPGNYVSAAPGISYLDLYYDGNGDDPNFSIPIQIAFLPAASGSGGSGGGGSGSGGAGGSATSDLHLINASWKVKGRSLIIAARQIINRSTVVTSGSLEVQVWATTTPYRGGNITGHILGTLPASPLPPLYHYDNVRKKVAYRAPPKGRRYTCILLSEYVSNQFVIRDYTSFGSTKFP